MVKLANNLRAGLAMILLLSAGTAAARDQATGPAAKAATSDQGATKTEARLSLREIAAQVEAQGYRDIEEIEREGESYEVCAKDAQGREVELEVNARTGKIEKVEPCDD